MQIFKCSKTGLAGRNFTTFEDNNCRHTSYTILDGQFHVLGHINFGDNRIAFIFFCKFIDDWTQPFAGRSGRCEKINQNREVRIQCFFDVFGVQLHCHLCVFQVRFKVRDLGRSSKLNSRFIYSFCVRHIVVQMQNNTYT